MFETDNFITYRNVLENIYDYKIHMLLFYISRIY